MTQRDKKTLVVLSLSLVGTALVGYMLYKTFLEPMGAANAELRTLRDKVFDKDRQISLVKRDELMLQNARARSLSANQDKARVDYDRYLVTLLKEGGMTDVQIQGPPPAAEPKAGGPATPAAINVKQKAGHTVLTYGVRAKGNLYSVVKVLEGLQRTPALHRVKAMNLRRQDNAAKDIYTANLNVDLTVEAMILADADPKVETKLKPDSSIKLPTVAYARNYADVAKKNIFVGPPYYVEKKAPQIARKAPPPEGDLELRKYLWLTHTEPSAGLAWLKDRYTGREYKIKDKTGTGYDIFALKSEVDGTFFHKAKVLRIDQREVYVQVKDEVYAFHVGQTFYDAMYYWDDAKERYVHNRLTLKQIEDLKLTKLMVDPKVIAVDDPDSAAPKKGGFTFPGTKTKKKG